MAALEFSPGTAFLWFSILLAGGSIAAPAASGQPDDGAVEIARPTPQQAEWQDFELGVFIHFAPNTWLDKEYDDLSLPLEKMNPAQLDTEQWAAAAEAMGAKYMVFVAKHVGGFCMWQTQTTEYGVKSLAWRDGKGDVLADLVESCRKRGIKLGVYLSPADAKHGAGVGGRCKTPKAQKSYNEIYRKQLTEVLSQYGEMVEVWFDGSNVVEVGDILAKHAPRAMVFQGPHATIRWVGNESGVAPYPAWNSVSESAAKSGVATARHGDPDGAAWMPNECDARIRSTWFWNTTNAPTLKSVDQLMEMYYQSVGRGAVLLLNHTPDPSGLIPEADVKRGAELGAEIRRRFGTSEASTDGSGRSLELELDQPTWIDHVITMEDIRHGERVRRYVVEGLVGKSWQTLCEGSAVGHKRIDQITPVQVAKVRLRVLDAAGTPRIRKFAVYAADGEFYRGEGDGEYLRLLDVSRRMLSADPELQNVSMLYNPLWNGFVEGPTWGAWWVQNSYGPTYCALPFYEEPFVSFLQNAQDLWFDQMGDGRTASVHGWVAPDGCLCDAASPGWFIAKQGDGRTDIHDWGMEFTAAGLLLQSELLLIGRDRDAIQHYLPKLRRCVEFIETRRDADKNLFLAGPAGNLLAPSYAGYKKPDGTYGRAYLAGLSITYIAALERLVELEKLAGDAEKVTLYSKRRDSARQGLAQLTTPEGYFIKSLDPDGTRHGVYGAEKHGYFEAVANHDAVCFRVTDDAQSAQIMDFMCGIPGLRPHDLVITNYPSLDDMYVPDTSWLWSFGTWVNGGHWTTCEARMIMAYYRVGRYDDARRSMEKIMSYAREFRMDNPLVEFGNRVYQPREPINICYDSFGAPAALMRGLFEYVYRADGLTLIPHVPRGITRLEQDFPVRFGQKRLYLSTIGRGSVTAVTINGEPWTRFDGRSVDLPYEDLPARSSIRIALGGAEPEPFAPRERRTKLPPEPDAGALASTPELDPVITTNDLPLRIGADSNAGSRFVGEFRRAMVFHRALSAAEIGALGRESFEELGRDPALVGHWTFDRSDGHTVPSLLREGLPATAKDDVSVVEADGSKVARLSGGFLEVADDPRLDLTRACTLAAWIRPGEQAAGGARILDKSGVGTNNGYLFDTYPGNSLRLIVERSTLSHDAKFPAGQWVFVAATAAPDGSLALYIAGELVASKKEEAGTDFGSLPGKVARIRKLHGALVVAGLQDSYEAAHARLVVECLASGYRRRQLIAEGSLRPLASAISRLAADRSYFSATARLCDGLEKVLDSYAESKNPHQERVHAIWVALPEPSSAEDLGGGDASSL